MAYRSAALVEVGGFDERFPRAYREDADLAYRVRRAGWRLVIGARRVTHPVRPEGPWVSLRTQRGNADDALLRRLHGPAWHRLLAAPRGRRHRHTATVAAGVAAAALLAVPARARRRTARRTVRRTARHAAVVAGLGWLAGTAEFAAARLRGAPGARLGPLVVTSALIPPLAVAHWLNGWIRNRHAQPWFARPGTRVDAGVAEEDAWTS
jgi:hypothetical protein